jgi:hypothetical protein
MAATMVLGLLRNDSRARRLVEKALSDPKPEVRSEERRRVGRNGFAEEAFQIIATVCSSRGNLWGSGSSPPFSSRVFSSVPNPKLT